MSMKKNYKKICIFNTIDNINVLRENYLKKYLNKFK